MTSFGKLVRQENLFHILEAQGKDEFIVFCFDRRYLSVNEEDIEALLDAETPAIEPRIPAFDGHLALNKLQTQLKINSLQVACNAYIVLFAEFDSYSLSIMKAVTAHKQLAKSMVDEHKFQSMALNVALTNLEDHRKLSEASIKDFVTRAKRELIRQQTLLNSADHDLHILRHVRIHPSIHALLESDKSSLLDFVDQTHLQQLRTDTEQLCDFLSDQIKLLSEEARRMKLDEKEFCVQVAENTHLHALDALLLDMQQDEESTRQVRKKVNRDLKRVCQKMADMFNTPVQSLLDSLSSGSLGQSGITSSAKQMFHAFDHLVQVHMDDYLPCLSDYELKVRKKVSELIQSKRNSIAMFIRNMAVVSEFQRHVGQIQPAIHDNMSYLDQFKSSYEGNDLERLRDILFSYGAVMIEVVRRREFNSLLIANSDLIADTMALCRTDEENRREYFRHTMTKSMPFKLTLIETPSPHCEISVLGMPQEQDGPDLKKQDITDFISIIHQVYSPHQQLAQSIQRLSLDNKKSSKLITTEEEEAKFLNVLRKMVKEIDDMKDDFLKYLKDNFFNGQHSLSFHESRQISSPVDSIAPSALTSSTASSVFSVIEDDKRWALENKDLKLKLASVEKEMEQQTDEISRLKETVKLVK
ncbi:hypothetical protein EDC96DRAFT_453219 [Choanephora cucurbitarum]|nr:hypothetical protein EDC96DRAFT_453219 [Choanephora cucurbitarum]